MRGWRLVLVALTGLLAAVAATVLAVALNAATGGTARWFPTMDRHPLWWTAGATAAVAAAGLVVWRVQGWYDRRLAELLPAVQQPEPWMVGRPAEVNQIVAALRNPQRRTVGITTAVQGAGGFGKTTVAKMVRADSRVLRQFSSRVYWVTIGRDVSGDALATLVNGLIARIDPDRALSATDASQAAEQLAAVLAKGPPRLVILDDVWTDEQLAAFPQAGRSARLLTTRNPSLAGGTVAVVRVDQMSPVQAQAVLLAGLPPLPAHLSHALLVQTGRWPLLLRLVNKILADQARLQPDISTAARDLLARLQGGGTLQVDELTGAAAQKLDVKDSGQRSKAVRATVQASAGLLSMAEHDRLAELGVFAANETVPVALAAALWKASGGLDRLAAGGLCARLADLALLNLVPGNGGGAIEVHDVIRAYLREELGPERLPGINQLLLDAAAADLPASAAVGGGVTAWWEVPQQAGYLLDHLIEHLLAAGRSQDAEAVACDLRWAASRLAEADPAALAADLILVGTPRAERLRRLLGQSAHLLASTELPHSQLDILFSRVGHDPDWGYQASILRAERRRPTLVSLWPMPDLPDPALRQVLDCHANKVNAVAIAPDGTWLASGGTDGSVRIWDPATGQGTVLAGHTDVVTAVAIAPDSTWLASASFDGSVRIWDAVTGEQRAALTVPTVPGARAVSTISPMEVAIAPDGTWLASTEIGGTVRIWDPATGNQRAALASPTGVTGPVAIAPDSTWLAAAGRSGTVRIWDAVTGSQRAVLTGHDRDAAVTAVAIATDGTWLATASNDHTVRIWDSATWRERAVLAGHTAGLTTLAIAPDGTWLATASWDWSMRIWDVATGGQRAVPSGRTGWGRVEQISIAPDGTWLAGSGDISEPVRIWDAATGSKRANLAIPVERGGWDKHVAVAPDGTWLASTESDGTVRIWDLTADREGIATTHPVRNVSAVAFAPDGTWLAGVVGDIHKPLRIWDTATGQQSAPPIPLRLRYMSRVAISPDGTWLALTWDGWLGTWSRVAGQYYRGAGHAPAGAVAIAPDGSWLATSSSDKTVRIWDTAATGQHRVAPPGATLTGATLTGATLTGHDDSVLAVAIAPDGTWLATASSDHTARIWDAATWSERAVLAGHDDSVLAVAIAADGTWLATASSDRSVRIWDTATGRQHAVLTGHTGPVRSVAVSPDGTWLATASSDRSVRIWDVAAARECAIFCADGELRDCAWNPIGQSLAVAGQTGMYLFALNP